jgi:hypothetical protein
MNILTLELPQVETSTNTFLNKSLSFIKNVSIFAKKKVVDFATGFYNHVESIGVLTLSAFGLSALLGEIPFWVTLPWWIETAMVIPVISVLTIYTLVTIGEKRTKKRLGRA